jgi:hypothetical protein
MTHIVERVALALLNDDRTRHGLAEATSLATFSDRDAYRSSARAAMVALQYVDGADDDILINVAGSRYGVSDPVMVSETVDEFLNEAMGANPQ